LFLKWSGLKKYKENKKKRTDKLIEKEKMFNERLDLSSYQNYSRF